MYSFIDGHCVERLENLYLPLLDKISSFLTRNGEKDYQQLWLSELDQENTFLHILARDAPYLLTEITRRQYFDSNLLQLENKKNETIHMLKDKAQNTFTLVKACFHIDIKAVQNLINQEINLNIQDKDGNSFLHAIIGRAADISSASFKNSLLIIDLLLNAGANPNHQNKKGDTPLHRAIITDRYYRHTEIMQRLCDKGANPLLKNLEGKTSLDLIGPSWHSGKRILQKALKGRLPKNL